MLCVLRRPQLEDRHCESRTCGMPNMLMLKWMVTERDFLHVEVRAEVEKQGARCAECGRRRTKLPLPSMLDNN